MTMFLIILHILIIVTLLILLAKHLQVTRLKNIVKRQKERI